MNVVYDLIFFARQRFGGISRCWMELFRQLPGSAIHPTFLAGPADNMVQDFLEASGWMGGEVVRENPVGPIAKLRQLGFYRNFQLLTLNESRKPRVFHSTDYINPLLCRPALKSVVTIHDMVFWDQSDKFARNVWYWDKMWCTWHSIRSSDRVIAVSEASRQAILRRFPWAERKIVVVHHGLDESFREVALNPDKKKRFVFIGRRNGYKNYDTLLEAFAEFTKDFPDWELHAIGDSSNQTEAESQRYRALGVADKVVDHGLISQEMLVGLLSNCGAVVIPSLNEGFNFPLLEGMAAGAHVISSDLPVSREIGQTFPEYFVPTSTVELTAALRRAAESPPSSDHLLAAQRHARSFRWEDSFRKTVAVYEDCLGR